MISGFIHYYCVFLLLLLLILKEMIDVLELVLPPWLSLSTAILSIVLPFIAVLLLHFIFPPRRSVLSMPNPLVSDAPLGEGVARVSVTTCCCPPRKPGQVFCDPCPYPGIDTLYKIFWNTVTKFPDSIMFGTRQVLSTKLKQNGHVDKEKPVVIVFPPCFT